MIGETSYISVVTEGFAILGGWTELLILLGVLGFFLSRPTRPSPQSEPPE